MKFRDREIYDIKVVEKVNSLDLTDEIKFWGKDFDIIDLQYSTRVEWLPRNEYPVCDNTGRPILNGITIYSAILLIAERK